jgi:hypothetical protein
VISIHGDTDGSVPHAQSVQLHAALKALGVTEKLVTIPRGGHGGFPRTEDQRVYAAIEQFLGDLGIHPVAVGVKSDTSLSLAPVSIDPKC